MFLLQDTLTIFTLKNIELIQANSDLGAGTRGAGFGAEALLMKANRSHNSLLHKLSRRTCDVPLETGFSSPNARNIERIYLMCKSISRGVADCLSDNRFPLVISGDHSCAAGTIAGIKVAKPSSRLGVIWIDAHSDIHSPYTTPSGNVHGMTLAASINDDNRLLAKQAIDIQTRLFWERLKRIGNVTPKVLPRDIVYISLRDFEDEELHLIHRHGMKCITTETWRCWSTYHIFKTIVKQLEFCTDIYVSFDADCLDASISRGTGLPSSGGIMPWEAEQIIELLMADPRITCLEFTELNPFFDQHGETTAIIYQIIEKSLLTLQKETTERSMEKLMMG